MVVSADYSSKYILQKSSLGRRKKSIGSLTSHIGILNEEFGELLAAEKLSKVWYWYKKLVMHVQTHRDHSIPWIDFDEAFTPLQWAHLRRYQIIKENTCPDWVCRQTCGWLEITNGEKIVLDARYQYSELFVMRLVYEYAAEQVF